MNGEWVRHYPPPDPAQPHVCQPPEREQPPPGAAPDLSWLFLRPDADYGSVWRCSCGRLWQVRRPYVNIDRRTWRPVRWWLRWRYRP